MMRPGSPGTGTVLLATLALLLGGCPDDSSSSPEGGEQEKTQGDGPITRVEGFDHQALEQALQGDWLIVQGDKRVFEFTILGEEVRVLDHRFAQPRTTWGSLLLRSSTSFGIEAADGTSYFFSFFGSCR